MPVTQNTQFIQATEQFVVNTIISHSTHVETSHTYCKQGTGIQTPSFHHSELVPRPGCPISNVLSTPSHLSNLLKGGFDAPKISLGGLFH